jgi:hypothetical protein
MSGRPVSSAATQEIGFMAMNFEGMDETTRWYRVSEFEAEMEGEIHASAER